FAAALLRERPVEAEIDPLFDVLDELSAGLDFDRAYERFRDELFSKEDCPELELALRRGFGLDELRQACEHIHRHRYLLPLTLPERDADDLAPIVVAVGAIADELGELLATHEPGDDKAVEYVLDVIEWARGLGGQAATEQERR